jgi:S-DNA-T family DNA segregation ATPase FtsK/SpoIIIE
MSQLASDGEDRLLAELRHATRQLIDCLAHQQTLATEEARQTNLAHQDRLREAQRERSKESVRSGDECGRRIRRAVESAVAAAAALEQPIGSAGATPLRLARIVRLGDLARPPGEGFNDRATVPLLLPMLNTGNVLIDTADTAAGYEVALTLLFEALASTSPGLLQLHVIDPTLSGSWAPFGRLGETGSDLAPRQGVEPADIAAMLTHLTGSVSEVSQLLQGRWSSLAEFLEASAGEDQRPFHVLLVLDYPRGFDERTHSMLVRLAERGPQHGVSLIVHHDPTQPAVRDVRPSDLHEHAERLVLGQIQRWERFSGLVPSLRPVPDVAAIHALCEGVALEARSAARPTVDLKAIVPSTEAMWGESSGPNLIATIGKRGSKPVAFTIGDSDDNWHNVLVGGSVGSGKSNLLLTLIYGLASRYSPDELEMYLLDFKEGVEFARFARDNDFLPHARVVGIEADPDLGKGVLQALVDEFERRSELFKAEGVPNLYAYRQRTAHTMARQLLVVDEFQVLLDDSHPAGRENVRLLEILARKGRAYGIHVVLSSQTLSGIESLATKRNSIFSQFPVRIALKTDPHESEIILGVGNTGAAQLRYRGEAILNTNYGTIDANRQVVVAHASDQALAFLDRQFADLRRQMLPPKVVRGGELASPHPHFAALLRRRTKPIVTAILGEPLRPGGRPCSFNLPPEAGRHLVIGGDGTTEAVGMLHAATISLALGLAAEATFVVVDAAVAGVSQVFAPQELCGALGRLGHHTRIVRSADELDTALDQRFLERTFLVGLGLDDLNVKRPGYGGDIVNALQHAVRNGHQDGTTLIGWWQRPKLVDEQLGSDWRSYILGRVLLKMDLRSSQVWTDDPMLVSWSVAPGRAAFTDFTTDGTPEPFIPFRPLSATRLAEIRR